MEERVTVAGIRIKNTARLIDKLDIAVGMKVMVMMNIATEADIANGMRGTIEEIVLDDQEHLSAEQLQSAEIQLWYPPALIIFRLDIPSEEYLFPGLGKGLIPLVVSKGSFSIETKGGRSVCIHRRQFAITAAYAFTHHKCQGQTIEYMIVDLGKPLSGKLDAFNAYVALSRSCRRGTIHLLRHGEDALFMNSASTALQAEDIRLSHLTRITAKRFEDGMFAW